MTADAGPLEDFLSRDPERIAQALRHCQAAQDPALNAALAARLADIEASFNRVDIDPEVRREMAAYFWELEKIRRKGPVPCDCATYRGNPSRYGGRLRKLGEEIFGGHSRMQYACTSCGFRYLVVEDVGYHVPQYEWRSD